MKSFTVLPRETYEINILCLKLWDIFLILLRIFYSGIVQNCLLCTCSQLIPSFCRQVFFTIASWDQLYNYSKRLSRYGANGLHTHRISVPCGYAGLRIFCKEDTWFTVVDTVQQTHKPPSAEGGLCVCAARENRTLD